MTEVKKAEEQQAAKPPARRYEVIKPGERVERCSYILPNSCQCWKAGEERVFEALTNPAKDEPKERSYQFCERHVRIQKAIDAGLLSQESVNTTLKEQTIEPPAVPEPPAEKEKQDAGTKKESGGAEQRLQQERATGKPNDQPPLPTGKESSPLPSGSSGKEGEATGKAQGAIGGAGSKS